MATDGGLLKALFRGDRRSLSRMISQIEDRSNANFSIMAEVQRHCGKAEVIGITGPPGSGKSTLVDQLIRLYRQEGKSVGVIAVDPSSPFSGGAILGDRIRMQDHATDDGVFIRSLGSRGSQGGLSRATREVVKLLDAAGFDLILVETVGVGQAELDIMKIAQTTVVLLTPESGDAIQTLKAGILEIADIFGVNKSDREGADRIILELKSMIELTKGSNWQVPVLSLVANKGTGIPELVSAIRDHQAFLRRAGSRRADSGREEVLEIVWDELKKRLHFAVKPGDNPYQVAEKILKEGVCNKWRDRSPKKMKSAPR